MKPVVFALQFRGVVSPVETGVLLARATAPGGSLLTVVDEDGVHGHFDSAAGGEAVLESRLHVGEDGGLAMEGTIAFGHRHSVRFRSTEGGSIGPSPDIHLRHGCAISEIEGGQGQFAEARGRITSNLFLSDTGELTDNQLGLVFIVPGTARQD